jgi:ABC-type Fe3+ transport system permease subunit
LSPFFIGVLRATHSIGLSLCIFAVLGSAMAYLVLRSHFKARRVFDKS